MSETHTVTPNLWNWRSLQTEEVTNHPTYILRHNASITSLSPYMSMILSTQETMWRWWKNLRKTLWRDLRWPTLGWWIIFSV